jgi:hypothetical protein
MQTEPITASKLGSKVRKLCLPTFQGRPGPEAPRQKRLLLPQGELAHVYDGPEPIQYIAFLELRAGTTRGNHFHKVKKEWLYVATGKVRLKFRDLATKAEDSLVLEAGQTAVISPEVAHALEVLEPGYGLEFSPALFDPADVYACPLT